MPEFFLELFSEEIPARMQKGAATELWHKINAVPLAMKNTRIFFGPRRIAISATLEAEKPRTMLEARGPREGAPEGALIGFLNKHGASRDEVLLEGGYFVLRRNLPAVQARDLLMTNLPGLLSLFGWPKSMRWGQSGEFSWIRPLRRIVCLLDGDVVPFALGPVTASNQTEGHRFLAPGALTISSGIEWEAKLKEHYVIADEEQRRKMVFDGLSAKAAILGLQLVNDESLMDEVTGLVEWPVALIGKIDEDFMDLPPEVRELSMKVNQRYFAIRDLEGNPAPYFAFVSNIEAPDCCRTIVAGNERVLRARLSDARHFWDIDLKTSLGELLPKLEGITFHAKIGTQRQRASRIANLAVQIADMLGADGDESMHAGAAGLLAKADLVTGMVGEFPELQGVMGGYYAEKKPLPGSTLNGTIVGSAIRTHYMPKGPSDPVPRGIVSASVALADKLDMLTRFFAADEKPTGSSDPYALRRAALGVIRIILDNQFSLHLNQLIESRRDVLDFIIERLRVKLRNEGERFDILDAVLGNRQDDNLLRLMQTVDAIREFLATEDGRNLLVAYRRASNILKIEDAKDGPHRSENFRANIEQQREERELGEAIGALRLEFYGYGDTPAGGMLEFRKFKFILENFAQLRSPVDSFFDKVTVNAADPEIRRNRLSLLAQLRDTMHQIADFSKIEG
jgi:glycyl-tRNA synthetase beta chain